MPDRVPADVLEFFARHRLAEYIAAIAEENRASVPRFRAVTRGGTSSGPAMSGRIRGSDDQLKAVIGRDRFDPAAALLDRLEPHGVRKDCVDDPVV
jgi:hypothetical protein